MAQTIVVLVKGIDLSVGPSVSLTTVFCASMMSSDGHNMVVVIVGALLIGILIGIINGGVVVLGGLQPIIVTLAMSSILTGVSLFIMPQPGGTVPGSLNWLVAGDIGFLPVPFVLLVVVSFAIWWPLRWLYKDQLFEYRRSLSNGVHRSSRRRRDLDLGWVRKLYRHDCRRNHHYYY